MFKLMKLSLSIFIVFMTSAHAAENKSIKDLTNSSVKSISSTNSKELRIKRAQEFKDEVTKMSVDKKNSDDWIKLSVSLVRVKFINASAKECDEVLWKVMLDDDASDKSKQIQAMPQWDQKEKALKGILSWNAFTAFQVLKAVCE